METHPSLSTDQLAAFVELSRQGSLRAAAEKLFITEQGIRNRLVALEGQLHTELYRKRRGTPSGGQLTEQGMRLLPLAVQILDQASAAFEALHGPSGTREVHVAASQYLILYVLIDVVRTFHARYPDIRIRLSSHTEQQIESALLADPALALGVAAPYEPSAELEYQHLFSLDWHLITPPRHPLLRKRSLSLKQLSDVPLILLERG